MNRVTQRESSGVVEAGLLEASAQASAAPAAGQAAGKAPIARKEAPTNRLEAYSGPPPSLSPSNRPPAAGSAGGGVTAGQLALGGGRAPGEAQLAAAYESIRGRLSTHLGDWAVTDVDVRRVHEQLEQLAPADYRRMLERMESRGLLDRYVQELGPEAREAFLSQAERKGCVRREPGLKAPTAPGQPPDGPSFRHNDSALPASLRRAVHESNRAAKRAYSEAHQAYVQRYVSLAEQARGVLDMRSLGEPVAPFSLSEPGVEARHPDHARFLAGWARDRVSDTRNRAYQAVSGRMAELGGGMRPGALWFKVDLELQARAAGRSIKLGGDVTLTNSGKVQGGLKEGVELQAHGIKVGGERDFSGGRKGQLGLEAKGVGVALDSEGALRLEVPVAGPAAAFVEVDQAKGRFAEGVSLKKGGEHFEAKVELSVGMQGARPERAQDVASREPGTLFGPLPELEQAIPWERLEPRRRERMLRDGWTASDWEQALRQVELRRRAAATR